MKLIGFFGGDSRTGCTTLAYGVARELASRGHRTLLICASGKVSVSYTAKELCHSLDDLRAAVISGRLSSEELHQAAETDGGLEIIGDVRNTFTAKMFPVDTFEIIKSIAQEYSFVIIDAGNRLELALAVSALKESDKRYFVITQNPGTINRFREIDDYILRQLQCDFKIILNRFSKDFAFYRKNEIEAIIERKIEYVIPDIDYGIYAEFERKSALVTKGGKRIINEITDGILQGAVSGKSRRFFSRGIFGEDKEKQRKER